MALRDAVGGAPSPRPSYRERNKMQAMMFIYWSCLEPVNIVYKHIKTFMYFN